MADAASQTATPEVVNDGWGGRTAQMTLGFGVGGFVAATAGWLWLDKMTADQWVSFMQMYLPLLLGIFGAKTWAEKRIGQ